MQLALTHQHWLNVVSVVACYLNRNQLSAWGKNGVTDWSGSISTITYSIFSHQLSSICTRETCVTKQIWAVLLKNSWHHRAFSQDNLWIWTQSNRVNVLSEVSGRFFFYSKRMRTIHPCMLFKKKKKGLSS